MALDRINSHYNPDEAGPNGTDGYRLVSPGVPCFYCGKTLQEGDPIVVWDGYGPKSEAEGFRQVSLHPPCALKLVTRLTRDIHEAELKGFIQISGTPGSTK